MIACVAFSGEAFAATKKVAVYVEGGISQSDKSIVCNSVMARISRMNGYQAFERSQAFINALDRENDYQTSGEVAESEIRAVGERMGVDFVIVVNCIISSDGKCHMAARLIKLVTGEIVKSVNIKREYTGTDVLESMAGNVSYRLLGGN